MLYDASILSLMIIGVSGMAVYSFKMSRSRAYPVGIVHEPVAIRAREEVASAAPHPAIADDKLVHIANEARTLGLTAIERAAMRRLYERHEIRHQSSFRRVSSAHGSVLIASGMSWKYPPWSCPKCGVVQVGGTDLCCVRCGYDPKLAAAKETDNPAELRVEASKTPLQAQVTQHDRTLQDIEDRIRKLEKASVVQKIDERQAAKAGPPDWVN